MDAQNLPRGRVAAARARVPEAAEELRRLRRQLLLARQSQRPNLQPAVRGREPEERVLLLIAVATRLEPFYGDCQYCRAVAAAIVETGPLHARNRRGNLGLADSG